jgi:hypothetical protein
MLPELTSMIVARAGTPSLRCLGACSLVWSFALVAGWGSFPLHPLLVDGSHWP